MNLEGAQQPADGAGSAEAVCSGRGRRGGVPPGPDLARRAPDCPLSGHTGKQRMRARARGARLRGDVTKGHQTAHPCNGWMDGLA